MLHKTFVTILLVLFLSFCPLPLCPSRNKTFFFFYLTLPVHIFSWKRERKRRERASMRAEESLSAIFSLGWPCLIVSQWKMNRLWRGQELPLDQRPIKENGLFFCLLTLSPLPLNGYLNEYSLKRYNGYTAIFLIQHFYVLDIMFCFMAAQDCDMLHT